VRSGRYELVQVGADTPIRLDAWGEVIRCGVELEMNAYIVRTSFIKTEACPRCGKEFGTQQGISEHIGWTTWYVQLFVKFK
jgi:hypothetical protein